MPDDVHATLAQTLLAEPHRFSIKHNNRDEIPTDFGGEAVQEIFG